MKCTICKAPTVFIFNDLWPIHPNKSALHEITDY